VLRPFVVYTGSQGADPATITGRVLQVVMKSFSLKKRIMLPFIVAGLATFFAGALFVTNLEEHQKSEAVLQQAAALRSHVQSILAAKAEGMEASLRFIADNKALADALKAANRGRLLAIGAPIYERLNRENNVTHFYFHNAKRINLLRVHKPEKHGDTINRFTTLGAEKNGKVFSGIELGPLGTFTLRSVLPVFENGQLLGYLELGQEIDSIINQTHFMFHVDLFMLIDKQYLSQSAWEEGMSMLGRPFDWNMLSTSVLVSQSLPKVPVEAFNIITDQAPAGIRLGKNIEFHGLNYWPAIIPIRDAGGRPVANLVMLRDMTKFIADTRLEMATFTGISAALGLLILILFYFVLGKAELELTRSQAALEEMVTKFKTMFESSSDALMMLDEKGFFDCNSATLKIFNCPSRDVFIGTHPSRFSPPTQPGGGNSLDLANKHIATAFKAGSDDFEWMHCQLDGSTFPAEVLLTSMPLEGRQVLQASVRDISERKKAEEAIERAMNIQRVLDRMLNISLPPLTLKEVLSASLDAILSVPSLAILNKGAIFLTVQDEQTLELVVHRNLPDSLLESCALLPFGKCLCGKAAATREIVFFDHLNEEHEIKYDGIQPHGHYCIPIMLEKRLLGVLNIYVAAGHVSDEEEKHGLKTVADTLGVVIERKQAEEALKQLAHNDILTGLPNRILFYDRMEQAQALSFRRKEKFGVLFLDLDHFKEINDTLGHDMGDLLLKMAADRLLGCVRASDTVARMGGDEFTVILTETKVPDNVELVANNILKALSEPFELGGKPHNIGSSIGIAIYPDDGRDSETLVKHADIAMYNAKRKRNCYCFFTDDLKGEA